MKKTILCTFILMFAIIAFSACDYNKNVTGPYTVTYIAELGGFINGETNQTVLYGEDASTVIAESYAGYEFIGWSDGVTTAKRTDKNLTKDITLTAQFRKLSMDVTYLTDGNGYIEGETNQTVIYGENATAVTAIPNENYDFIGWSDGIGTPKRIDRNIMKNFIVTAQFRRHSFFITYRTEGNGYIDGETNQTVLYGKNATIVTAIPNEGYMFTGWSDGVSTAKRRDDNVTKDIIVTAKFSKRRFGVLYYTDGNGYIDGETNQAVFYGEDATTVTAVPNDNYDFIGWSDGVDTPTRTDKNVTDFINVTAQFRRHSFFITYQTDGNGYIDGEANQTVLYGKDATAVTAIPNQGYEFAGWSDEVTTAKRTDEDVTEDLVFVAYFRKWEKTFTYFYGRATTNNAEKDILLDYDKLKQVKMPVPERINSNFEGWYLEKTYKTQVSDKDGNILIDDYHILDNDDTYLYAKFSLIEEIPSYKVLMVYVTQVKGAFLPKGTLLDIDYKMSDKEKELSHLLTKVFEATLNDGACGLVHFEVDEYFTQQPVSEENFSKSHYEEFNWNSYYIFGDNIPEISNETRNEYRSIITVVGVGSEIHIGFSGIADDKYGCAFLDDLYRKDSSYLDVAIEYLSELMDEPQPMELCFKEVNTHYENWTQMEECNSFMDTCLHEFTHTAESYYDGAKLMGERGIQYHDAIYEHSRKKVIFETIDYLFHSFEMEDGSTVGIPYTYWKDELYFSIKFSVREGGYILGKTEQKVKAGRKSETVIAVPEPGYRFESWMNFKFPAEFTIYDVRGDAHWIAFFEKIPEEGDESTTAISGIKKNLSIDPMIVPRRYVF